MTVMLLDRQFHIKAFLICRIIQLLCQRKAVLIIGTTENPKLNPLFLDRLKHFFHMILQNRNPRALQDQPFTACRGKCNRPQKHITSGRKTTTDDFLITFILYCLQCFRHWLFPANTGSQSSRAVSPFWVFP